MVVPNRGCGETKRVSRGRHGGRDDVAWEHKALPSFASTSPPLHAAPALLLHFNLPNPPSAQARVWACM